ncbi:MAG: PorP/SprF family type IX secretion system membrane protein [Bacteroidales bacterium]|nr:PorP/SprF family type IX secretion system membrane protein [Bacteroidales bacterium]
MKNKKIYILFLFVLFVLKSNAQQDPQFTQYMYSDLLINPGVAGSAGICATGMFRQQWAGFQDTWTDLETGKTTNYSTAPQQILLTLHAPIKVLHGGLGLSVSQDKLGYQNDIAAKLAYSFKFNISGGSLGLGIAGDFLSRTVHGSDYHPIDPGDPVIATSDKSDFYIDLSFGAYYLNPNKWYAGISATHLLTGEGKNTHQKTARHYYLYGGYNFALPFNPNWTMKPSAMIKTDFVKAQYDLTVVAEWNNIVWGGVSWRIANDAVALLVGAKPFINSSNAIRGLEIGVSYDITTSKLGYNHGRSFGGPEIMLKYCFTIIPPTSVYGYQNTRLLGNKPIEY